MCLGMSSYVFIQRLVEELLDLSPDTGLFSNRQQGQAQWSCSGAWKGERGRKKDL